MTVRMLVIVFTLLGVAALAAAEQPATPSTYDPENDPACAHAREQVADLLASDAIERIDVVAMTFDDAMELIYTTVDGILARAMDRFEDPVGAAAFASDVVEAFDSHEPRGLSMTFLEDAEIEITDSDKAESLGALLGAATVLVRQHVGADASPERVRAAATGLFRSVVLEPDGGMSYLDQYLTHVETVAAMSPSNRVKFFEAE